jgi:hypothetical protein
MNKLLYLSYTNSIIRIIIDKFPKIRNLLKMIDPTPPYSGVVLVKCIFEFSGSNRCE